MLTVLTCSFARQASAIDECTIDSTPLAGFQFSCSTFNTCTFNSTSSDAQGLVSQEWSFGDGSGGLGASVGHTFPVDGVYLVTLSVTDTAGQMATAMSAVLVGNSAPLATDDEISAEPGKLVSVPIADLLANDAYGVHFVGIDSQGSHGIAGVSGGNVTYQTYQNPSNFEGLDTFVYSVADAVQHTGQATVHVRVAFAPPVANPDYFQTGVNAPVLFTTEQLRANDIPPSVLFVGFQNQFHGTVAFEKTLDTGETQYRFTPALNFSGTATFEYLISRDGSEPIEAGLVYVTVTDQPPSADFWLPTCVNRTCTFRQHALDDLGIVDYYWQWGDGTSQHDSTGGDLVHTYATSGRFVVRLTVTDTGGHATFQRYDGTYSDREVTANTKPVAVNDTATTERDIAVTIPVLTNDTDADGDSLSLTGISVNNPGAQVQVVALASSYALRFTPPDGYVGTLTISYAVADPWGGVSAPVNVTVNVTQWTSITDALGEQLKCPYQGTITFFKSLLLSNDYDSDGDTLSIVNIDTTVMAGLLDCTTDPTKCTYRAVSGQTGSTFFRYTATDPAGHRDTATVRIYVGTTVGSTPILSDDVFTTMRNTSKSFTRQDVVQNDVDADGDTLLLTLANGPREFGSLTCLPSTFPYQCTYTPTSGFVGLDRFPYTATDGINPSLTANIRVLTLPPTTPTFDAREDMRLGTKNTHLWMQRSSFTTNDFDPEGDPITVTSVDSSGLAGTLTCDATWCDYAPGYNWTGMTRFKYTATDGHGSSDTAYVKIRVGTGNTVPVASPDTFTTAKNTPLKFSVFELLSNDYDADNDPLAVTISTWTATKGVLTCGTPQYWCTYTPNANVTGTETINYTIVDADSTTSNLKITITP